MPAPIVDRYSGPNGEAVPTLTRKEKQACMVSSMLRFLETGEYVQYQPVDQTGNVTKRKSKKKRPKA